MKGSVSASSAAGQHSASGNGEVRPPQNEACESKDNSSGPAFSMFEESLHSEDYAHSNHSSSQDDVVAYVECFYSCDHSDDSSPAALAVERIARSDALTEGIIAQQNISISAGNHGLEDAESL